MAYTKTVWANEVPASTPVKYEITDDTAGVIAASATIDLVTSVTAGTAVDATNLNHLEDGLEAVADQVDALPAFNWLASNILTSFTTAATYTYTMGAGAYADVPATAQMVFVEIWATWAVQDATSFALVRDGTDPNKNFIRLKGRDDTVIEYAYGWVKLDASGVFKILVGKTATSGGFYISGYYG